MSRNDGSFFGLDSVAAKVDRLTDNDVFNWKASNTRRAQRALAAAAAGAGLFELVAIGDGQTYQRNTATWVTFLRNRLAAMGYPIAGTGWVWSNDGFNNYDSRISKAGTWGIVGTHSGAGYTTATSSGATMTFVSDLPGTTIGVAYLNTSAAFTVAVDGGSAVTVTPDGTSTVGIYTVTGLADAAHTIVVTTSSATAVQICGFRCDRTTGVRIHNLAGNGWEAEGFYSNPGTTHPVAIINTMVTADAVHAAFGLGDVAHGRTAAQLANNVKIIRGYFPNSDFVLYAGMENSTGDLSTHVRAMYDVAVDPAVDCPLVDIWRRSGGPGGGYARANANGLMADTQNPSAKGHQLWAEVIARLMAVPLAPRSPDVQVFSATGTWVKPAGAKMVRGHLSGPAGSGGSGARVASGIVGAGGGGGGAGGIFDFEIQASLVTDTVAVTVGTGGVAAAAQTTNSSAGNNGSPGSSATTFGAYFGASRGSGGVGGGIAAAGPGGAGGSAGTTAVGAGASSAAAGTVGVAGGGGANAGGGSGAGVTAAPAASNGGTGGSTALSLAAAGVVGVAGGAGAAATSPNGSFGGGGAGGASSITGAGGSGGKGATPGGGGGGGGASLNGNNSGPGEAGGDGVAIITTYF